MTTQKKIDIRNVIITEPGKLYGNSAGQKILTNLSSIAHFINTGMSQEFIKKEEEKFIDFINFLINETSKRYFK